MAVLLTNEELAELLAKTKKKPVKLANGGTANEVLVPGTLSIDLPESEGGQAGSTVAAGTATPAATTLYNADDPNNPLIKKTASAAYDATKINPQTISAPTSVLNPTTLGAYNNATAATVDRTSAANVPLNDLLTQLSNQAQGVGPSVAGTQLQQGREANLAAIMAQAQSSRGGFNPLVARTAMQTGAEMQAKANQEAALQRLQEQQAAQQLLSTTGTTMRGQDYAAGTTDAQLKTTVALQNASKDLEQKIAQGQITASEAAQLRDAIQKANMFNATQTQDADLQTQTLKRGQLADLMNYITGKNAQTSAEEIAARQSSTQKNASMLSSLGSAGAAALPYLGQVFGAAGSVAGAGVGGGESWAGGDMSGAVGGILAAQGGEVPGKAPKEGDHPENDIIPAKLSPGEFVIPRSLTQDKELMDLVHKKMAEKEASKQQEEVASGFAEMLKAQRELHAKVDAIHKMFNGGAVQQSPAPAPVTTDNEPNFWEKLKQVVEPEGSLGNSMQWAIKRRIAKEEPKKGK